MGGGAGTSTKRVGSKEHGPEVRVLPGAPRHAYSSGDGVTDCSERRVAEPRGLGLLARFAALSSRSASATLENAG